MNFHPRLIAVGLTAGLFAATAFAIAPDVHEHLRAFDTDRNGRFSATEVEQAAAHIFARADADHDGSLTTAELRALHGEHGGQARHAGAEHAGPMTLAAFQAHLRSRMATADANHDGELSMDEVESMHGNMQHGQ